MEGVLKVVNQDTNQNSAINVTNVSVDNFMCNNYPYLSISVENMLETFYFCD